MIQLQPFRSVLTPTVVYDVESTPRGGHFVRISSILDGWVGLYRIENNLVLVARCAGSPPAEQTVSGGVRSELMKIIDAVCGSVHDP
jgi:hypothetical protein